MTPRQVFTRLAGRLLITPAVAIGMAIGVLVFGIGLAAYNEQLGHAEKVRQARTQAEILAASVAAPLAFDDAGAANDYLRALRADPGVKAAGAYSGDGGLLASFTGDGGAPPKTYSPGKPHIENGDLIVTADVVQGGSKLGGVYLRTSLESLPRRIVRYMGIAVVVLMASLMVAVLGAALASVSEAHRQLQAETREREKAEEALRQSQKMEAIGQLTAGLAHDFNNLLHIVGGSLERLSVQVEGTDGARYVRAAATATDRGAKLTRQLLAFARRSRLEPRPVDATALVSSISELLDSTVGSKAELQLNLRRRLPAINVDHTLLEMALLNIVINARDAVGEDGLITVSTVPMHLNGDAKARELEPGDYIAIEVTDNGVGMAPAVAARAVEPFFTTKSSGKGTGLGLAMVHGFVQQSGGRLEIETAPDQGTTIRMLFPVSPAEPDQDTVSTYRPSTPTPGQQDRILVVDDSPEIRQLAEETLRDLGYDIVTAESGDEALRLFMDAQAHHPFSLVFSDIVMPGGMNGLALADEIHNRAPEVPILLTTGYNEQLALEGPRTDAMDVLGKPYRRAELVNRVQAALRSGARGPNPRRPSDFGAAEA